MKDLAVRAANTIELMINTYGTEITVRKYQSTVTGSVYQQRTKTFDDGISVKCLVNFNPTEDMISAIGSAEEIDGVITFGRNHLLEKFPALDPEEAVNNKDELDFLGKKWRVIKAHPTGRFSRGAEVVVIGFAHLKGRKYEAVP